MEEGDYETGGGWRKEERKTQRKTKLNVWPADDCATTDGVRGWLVRTGAFFLFPFFEGKEQPRLGSRAALGDSRETAYPTSSCIPRLHSAQSNVSECCKSFQNGSYITRASSVPH